MIEFFLFYLFATAAVVSGLAILAGRNIVHMAYWLIGMLFAVAGLYFLMGNYFLGTVQIIVYVGGVAVLMIFGVMLSSRKLSTQLAPGRLETAWLFGASTILLSGLVSVILNAGWPDGAHRAATPVADMGKALLGKFLGPFELASILLLIVLLGAAYLARPRVPTIVSKDHTKPADEPSGKT